MFTSPPSASDIFFIGYLRVLNVKISVTTLAIRNGNTSQGGKAAFARVIAPHQGFRNHFFTIFLYEHIAWKKDEIKKSKNESPIRYTWSTRKEPKKLTFLHTYLLWIWQKFFFEICTIQILLYKSEKFAEGTCHRKAWKHCKESWDQDLSNAGSALSIHSKLKL